LNNRFKGVVHSGPGKLFHFRPFPEVVQSAFDMIAFVV